ncbi:MAG: L,D-transpeptidase family protein [Alphaproteobacteria bacterium]|nr:L,D-transpeptidase family protein [Alphaproteobacteria bacterium]
MALVSLDAPETNGVVKGNSAGELRPSLVAVGEPVLASLPHPATRPSLMQEQALTRSADQPSVTTLPELRPSRLSFVSPDVGELEFSDDVVEAAAHPESWSVEVQQRPATAAKPRRPAAARSKPSRDSKVGKTRKVRKKRYTLKQRLAEISPAAVKRVSAKFEAAKVAWPPHKIALLGIKDEKALELYARPKDGDWSFVHRYKVLAASGRSGPKLQRGDKQVPEGIYRISYLNPNSAYHVSMRVNYPNAFDRKMARKDGRKDLGGDIMIHGKNVSAGCLAVGDNSAEELFVLAAEVGKRNIKVVIAPTDFRHKRDENQTPLHKGPNWVPGLYEEIKTAMTDYRAPPPQTAPGLLSLLGLQQ